MKYEFVELYKHCKFKWYLKYGMEVENENKYSPTNPDLLQNLIMNMFRYHQDDAIEKYYSNFPIINNKHVEEVIKINNMFEKIGRTLSDDIVDINYEDAYIITQNNNEGYNLYQIQYNSEFEKSDKPGILKYKLRNEVHIENLKILYIPHVNVDKLKESTSEYRLKLNFYLDLYRPEIYNILYNQESVEDYIKTVKQIENDDGSDLTKNIGFHCYSCEYENICRRNRK